MDQTIMVGQGEVSQELPLNRSVVREATIDALGEMYACQAEVFPSPPQQTIQSTWISRFEALLLMWLAVEPEAPES